MPEIVIQEAQTKRTSQGQEYILVTGDDGRKYYAFDKKLFEILRPGCRIRAEAKEGSRGFWHITKAQILPADKTQELIAREVALKAAAEIVAAQISQGNDVGPKTVKEYASYFIDWLLQTEGPEPEPEPEPEPGIES